MFNSSAGCYESDELLQFLNGHLPPSRAHAISQHLAQCDACAERCGALDFRQLPIVSLLKKAHTEPHIEWLSNYHQRVTATYSSPPPTKTANPRIAELDTPHAFETLNASANTSDKERSRDRLHSPSTADRYTLGPLLGRGGMGSVYEAFDERLRRRIAIKFPSQSIQSDPSARQRFLVEARAAAAVHHPNVCGVLDSDEHDGVCFLTMPLLSGMPLSHRLKQEPKLKLNEVIRIIVDLCQGLTAVHGAGITHRDIKPSNLFLREDGMTMLMDFGVALPNDRSDRVTQSGAIVGTPTYFAPEQARGDPTAIGPATDIYAVGAVLFEMLAGAPPYRGLPGEIIGLLQHSPPPSLQSQYSACDESLIALCMKAMAKSPADRFPTAAAFATALEAWQAMSAKPKPKSLSLGRRLSFKAQFGLAVIFGCLTLALLVSMIVPPSPSTTESSSAETEVLIDRQRLFKGSTNESELGPITRTYMSQDGNTLAFLHEGPIASVWQADPLKQLAVLRLPKFDTTLTLSPDGKVLVTAGGGWHLRFWDLNTSRELASLSGHSNWINTIRFNQFNEWVASISKDRTLRLFDAKTYQPRWNANVGGWPRALAVSHSGQQIVTGCNDGSIKFWDASRGAAMSGLIGSDAAIVEIHYSGDDAQLASLDAQGSLHIREVKSGSVIWGVSTLPGSSLVMNPQGDLLAFTTPMGALQIVRVADGSSVGHLYRGESNSVWRAIGFSTDSQRIYSICDDSSVCVSRIAK